MADTYWQSQVEALVVRSEGWASLIDWAEQELVPVFGELGNPGSQTSEDFYRNVLEYALAAR